MVFEQNIGPVGSDRQKPDLLNCAAAAARYTRAGLRVLPIHTCTSGSCSCGRAACASPGKHPRLQNGVYGASADTLIVADWWNDWPDANIGIATGAGIIVIDVDGPEGEGSLAKIEAIHGPLPLTKQVQTGHGRHFYLRVPIERRLKNSASKIGLGLDVRGDGGYAVAPPSLHQSSRIYCWIENGADRIAWAPAFMLDLLDPPPPLPMPAKPIQVDHKIRGYVRRALEGELAAIAEAPVPTDHSSGGRNNALHLSAVKLGSLVGAGLLDGAAVEGLLLHAALACGLTEHEARATIASGMRFGISHPRELMR